MLGRTLRAMSPRIVAVPTWVGRSLPSVATTEDFLLQVYGDTGSPEAFGTWAALAWVGGLPEWGSPILHSSAEPTARRASTELEVAKDITCGHPFPSADWWAGEDLRADEVPSREFWEAHAGYESTRCVARGVAMGLAWTFGVAAPDKLVPRHREDGTLLSDHDQEECRLVLRELTVRPRKPPRLRLSPRPVPDDPRRDWRAPGGV